MRVIQEGEDMVVTKNGTGEIGYGVMHFYPLGTKVRIIDANIDDTDCVTCLNAEHFVDEYGIPCEPYSMKQKVQVSFLQPLDEDERREDGNEVNDKRN